MNSRKKTAQPFDFWNEKHIKIHFLFEASNKVIESTFLSSRHISLGGLQTSSCESDIPFYFYVVFEDAVTTSRSRRKQQRVKKGVKSVRWLQSHYISSE